MTAVYCSINADDEASSGRHLELTIERGLADVLENGNDLFDVLNKAATQGDLGLGVLKMIRLFRSDNHQFPTYRGSISYSFSAGHAHQHSHPASSLGNWPGHPWIKAGAIYYPVRPFDPSSAPVQAIRLTTTVYK